MGSHATKVEFGTFDEVSRAEWGARPPVAQEFLEIPVTMVVVHYTNTRTCSTKEECCKIIRELQDQHIDDKNFIDIKYNFLVGGDGSIYEGRGWHASGIRVPLVHESLMNVNFESVDIAFIGSVKDVEYNETMVKAFNDFVKVSQYKQYIKMHNYYLWMEGGDRYVNLQEKTKK